MMAIMAFGYIRVSGVGQAEGDGLGRQERSVREYAGKAGFSIQRFYQDVHSGTDDALDRPGFAQMVAELNGVKTIIVERLDRLARSVMVQEVAITWLAAHGIDLVVADTGEDVTQAYMDDPMKRALIQIQGIFAELEKSMLVKKLRLAREQKREENGKCEGRKAYGERDEAEQGLLSMIRKMMSGNSYAKIAQFLNQQGYRTRMGRAWTRNTVRNVVVGRSTKLGDQK